MSNLNKALLIGRLTKDPEMRYTPSGTAVTNFSIATNRWSTGPDGERKEFTDYHNIVAYPIGKRNLAETVAQYTRKGALVYIEGRIQTRSWEGQDGQKRRVTEIIANDVQFLEPRGSAAAAGTSTGTPAGTSAGTSHGAPAAAHDEIPAPDDAPRDVDPDDIPF
jgi:single stranded DNA-binding protein (ssb)